MNESPMNISNTCIISHNLIALTITFIKKKTKLSYIDLKKKDKQLYVCRIYIHTNKRDQHKRKNVLCNLGQLKEWILFP